MQFPELRHVRYALATPIDTISPRLIEYFLPALLLHPLIMSRSENVTMIHRIQHASVGSVFITDYGTVPW